ncbi:hypothetical protein CN918_30320 [Priestia megaterium]|nr:hypothetical protein CN918_30320 [Priestia megaterium]
MRNYKKYLLGTFVALLVMTAITVVSAAPVNIYVDGKKTVNYGPQPYLDSKSRAMVPIQFLNGKLGYKMTWSRTNKQVTVTQGSVKVGMKVGSAYTTLNGKRVNIGVPVVASKAGNVYVPLSFVAKTFQAKMWFNSKTKNVTIARKPAVPTLSSLPKVTQTTQKKHYITGKAIPKARVYYTITDKQKRVVRGSILANSQGVFTIAPNLQYLVDGTLTLTLQQTAYSNTSSYTTRTFIKKTSGPGVTTASLSPAYYTNHSNYTFSGKTTPYANVTVAVQDTTGFKQLYIVRADKNGDYSTISDLSPFKKGRVYVQAKATDSNTNSSYTVRLNLEKDETLYELNATEQEKWTIHNDGTYPIETTSGFNNALAWASAQGIHTFKVPAGIYLIKKGVDYDATARINMVSDMTFIADNKAIFQKETNGLTGYSVMYIGPQVKNAIIKGGVYKGEKDTHDYSISSTHEWGYGVLVEGGENIIVDDIEAYNFTGDGLLIGNTIRKGTYINSSILESGGLDENGNPTNETGRIRTVGRTQTNFDDAIYKELNSFYLWVPTGLTKNQYDVYFYDKDGKLLERKLNVNMWKGEVNIPKGADYFKTVLYADSTSGASVYRYAIDNSKSVTVKNSKMHDNRRQGITVGGGYGVLLENNEIYNIRGIAPQSGIDVEQGYGINGNVTIRNNNVHDNVYGVILYDGIGATVEENQIKNHSYPGLVVQEEYKDALVQNNYFENSGMSIKHDATLLNNEIVKGTASFYGPNVIIDGLKGTDALVDINSRDPFGIDVKNLTLVNTAEASGRLSIENQPVHFENVMLSGPSKVALLTGNVADGSIFDNLQIIGYKIGSNLPRGIYNNCRFESDLVTTTSGNGINRAGIYEFNHCAFVTSSTALTSNNADADISVNNSSFNLNNTLTYSLGIVSFDSAKKVNFVNNILDVRGKATKDVHLLRIGRSGWQSVPINVANVSVTNNEFYSDFAVNGIDTSLGGTNALPYTIQNNTLHTAKINLKANDISINNLLLAQ